MEGSAAASEEDLLLRIQSLVSDSLQMVSYKWVSRNFSVSSNAAKWLLQKFAEQNENVDLEIVYVISGWTKDEPRSYAIQLVPKRKLEEAKAALKETSSIHVYSVQRCLPKDPAQLWSADFVQAEQLFNEIADVNNCLRDNRYSAVTCDLVHRLSARGALAVTSRPQPQPPVSNGPETSSKPLVPKAQVPPPPPKNSGTDAKDASAGKKPPPTPVPLKAAHSESKNSSGPGTSGKRKVTSVASASGGGSALASMWGKAPIKSKAISPSRAATVAPNPPWVPVSADEAEAGTLATEAHISNDDDDMENEFASPRKVQVTNASGRRRRMIVTDEDSGAESDEMENIVRLVSPDSPQKKHSDTASPTDGAGSDVHQKKLNPKREILKVDGNLPKLEPMLNTNPAISGEKVEETSHDPLLPVPDGLKAGSKRKKVLKTRIDDRGREVTEVIWETDGEEKQNVEKETAAKHGASSSKQTDGQPLKEKPEAIQKHSTVPSKTANGKASTKPSSKASNKPGKGQGNIMSFFKKT